ncbi:hypothetical protein DVH24_008982 [Malus domestica]|uniref:Uncharacterized protein n=1 Tax=Malus domestica TaxID=3750 RepID=A0A498JL68_MALDO|nr:hypothetical protein DVH24_008982 [Malus domestica]
MCEDEWIRFLEKFRELLYPAFGNRRSATSTSKNIVVSGGSSLRYRNVDSFRIKRIWDQLKCRNKDEILPSEYGKKTVAEKQRKYREI